jgi:DNA-binding response OmpR family regulator
MRVLLIEDDKRLASLIGRVIDEEGIGIDVAYDGDTGLELALRGTYEVVIADWMLPGRDGPAICRAIRGARLQTACMLLTARSQIEDRVAGLDSGADDYMVKPFAFEELLARVRALGRRFAEPGGDTWELRHGDIVMDLKTHTARRGEVLLSLTPTEWRLLECFLRHHGQVMSRQQILDYVWSYESDVRPSMVDVYVSYLRARLKTADKADPIQTVRGLGYRMDAEDV